MATMAVLLWIIMIGFIAGMIARFVMPGPNKPKGFFLTTVLGVAGAILATVIGDSTGLLRPHQISGLIGAAIGALLILFIWSRLVTSGIIPDHGA
jgi:uncharacterized membrane protein YeaQ/YmgE (transglycosylase-associated protein family)